MGSGVSEPKGMMVQDWTLNRFPFRGKDPMLSSPTVCTWHRQPNGSMQGRLAGGATLSTSQVRREKTTIRHLLSAGRGSLMAMFSACFSGEQPQNPRKHPPKYRCHILSYVPDTSRRNFPLTLWYFQYYFRLANPCTPVWWAIPWLY